MARSDAFHALGSTAALAMALASASAWAQEVRGPESPSATSNAPSPASTATPEPADVRTADRGLEDIIVTARRVAENQQSVPVAVTAFSGDALQRQNAIAIPDVARLTPGLVIRTSSSTATGINLQLRGQYQNDVLATLDPSVGTYVDGFYWARAYGLNSDLLDVQSAQVLRGPQGTLFGRNTTGGALLIQTNDPVLDRFSGLLSGTYGRFNERGVTGVLNVPLGDNFAIRAAGSFLKRDGYVRELSTGADIGERDNYNIRVKALGKIGANLSVLLSAELYHTDALTRPYQIGFISPSSPANLEAALEAQGLPAGFACFASPAATGGCIGQGYGLFQTAIAGTQGTDTVTLNELPRSYAKTQTYTGTATLDTFFGAVKFIGGYRKVDASASLDLDGSPYQIVRTAGEQSLESYSTELQVTGKAFGDALDFTSGLYYFHEDGTDRSESTALPVVSRVGGGGLLLNQIFQGDVNNDSMGLYAQATYHFTDRFSLVGGLRYSVEDKDITVTNRRLNADTGATVDCLVTGATLPTCDAFRHASYDGISYTAGANYQLTPDVLLYVKTSKGFRSGGQNLRAAGAANSAFVPFNPEVSREHEAGVKSEFFDRRLRFNLAAFLSNVDNIQRSTIVASTINGATTTSTIVGNAGKARFYGGEAELTARVASGLTLSANGALVNASYRSYVDPSSGFDRSRERFEQVPQWTFSVAGNYEREFGNVGVLLHADYAWQDTTALSPFNYYVDGSTYRDATTGAALSQADAIALKRVMTQPAGGSLNLRAAVRLMDDAVEVAAFGRNVLDRRINNNALYFGSPLFIVATQRLEPATYGVTATFKFGTR
jgi:iron complex outermembrane receptor protein